MYQRMSLDQELYTNTEDLEVTTNALCQLAFTAADMVKPPLLNLTRAPWLG